MEISNVIEFLNNVSTTSPNTVTFTKADGSTRVMNFTMELEQIPEEHHPKNPRTASLATLIQSATHSGLLRVYDLESKGWRSFKFEQCSLLENSGEKWKVEPSKQV